MQRRKYLTLLGMSASFFSGCTSGDGNDSTPTPTAEPTPTATAVPTVSITEQNVDYTPTVNTVTLRYTTNTTTELQPPDSYAREPDPGNKFVVFHAQVTVQSELQTQIDVYGSFLGLQANGVIYDAQPIRNLPELTQIVVPEATYEAWASFEIPEGVTEATLVGQDVQAWFENLTTIVFEPDSSLSATIPSE